MGGYVSWVMEMLLLLMVVHVVERIGGEFHSWLAALASLSPI